MGSVPKLSEDYLSAELTKARAEVASLTQQLAQHGEGHSIILNHRDRAILQREAQVTAQAAEIARLIERLSTPARTGCDVCLEARRDAEAQLAEARAEIARLQGNQQ